MGRKVLEFTVIQNETIVVIDFGGQYNQLIARRVREANVYCVVLPYSKSIDEIKAKGNYFHRRSEQCIRP